MHKRYQYSNIPRVDSQLTSSFNEQSGDLFSSVVAWLADRTLFVFAAALLCLMLLSIACDQVLGSVSADASDAQLTQPEGPPSTAANVETQPSDNPEAVEQPSFWFDGSLGDVYSQFLVSLDGFSGLFPEGLEHNPESGRWRDQVSTLAFRLTLAAFLGGLIALRPRKSLPLHHRNPYVVQSQILLAVVACALMMIVGDNAARAFGIFAAASLVRFRTNISDPKEITMLLINLGVGLAAGVGRWELATMFTLFVLLLLQVLESYENNQAFHLTELSVRTHDVEATDEAVRQLFKRNNLDVDIRQLNKESEKHPLGKVVYSIDLKSNLNQERLAQEIYMADPLNIEKLEWHKKKAPSYA